MNTLSKVIIDGLPHAGASRIVALDHIRGELAAWSTALSSAISELDHCLFFDERQQDSDTVAEDADPDCTCAYCECVFAEREVSSIAMDLMVVDAP